MTKNNSTDELENTLRIAQAAKLLGVSTMTLRRWDQKGYLKPLRIGPRQDRRYMKNEILKLMKKQ